MHHPTDRMTHTTAFVKPVVEHWLEREIAKWVHPMKDWSDDPSHHERTLLPRSYISLPKVDGHRLHITAVWTDMVRRKKPKKLWKGLNPHCPCIRQALRTHGHRGARCSSVVRAFAHGAMSRRIDHSWGGPIELFLILASVPRLV